MGTFIPYADPALASASLTWPTQQYKSIVPFQNNATGVQAAFNTPGYQQAAVISANGLGFDSPGGGSGGASTTAPALTPATPYLQSLLGNYDSQINNINDTISKLPDYQNTNYQNIDNSYNASLNQLNQTKAQSEQSYNTQKTQTGQDYRTAKNSVLDSAGNALRGLQRLLGARGAGGGSAYLFSAPEAVTNQANQQRAGIGQQFGRNQSALDLNFNNYLNSYNNATSDLSRQREDQRKAVEQSIIGNRASLLSSLAKLQGEKASAQGGNPYAASQGSLDESLRLQAQANAPILQTPFQVAPNTYNAPTLESYTTNPFAAPTAGNSNVTDSTTSPFLAALLGKNRQQNKLAYGY